MDAATTGRQHLAAAEQGGPLARAVCGWLGVGVVERVADVTCRACRRWLRRRERRGAEQLDTSASAAPPVVDEAPWVPPPPRPVERQRWEHADALTRDPDARPRWPTWAAAVRAYVAWRDDGAPMRSPGDPSRFEVPPSGGVHREGDVAQRRAADLAVIGAALRGAYRESYVVRSVPVRVELDVDEQTRILIVAVAGADEHGHTGAAGGRRKQRIVRRVPVDAVGVALEASARAGAQITAGDVRRVVRRGAAEIERALLSRGAVAYEDPALRRSRADEEVEMRIGDRELIEGWGAVASRVGLSVRTALRAQAWTPPLPIRRWGGGRVEAWADELDAWRSSMVRATAADD